jgi:hypothetical protein
MWTMFPEQLGISLRGTRDFPEWSLPPRLVERARTGELNYGQPQRCTLGLLPTPLLTRLTCEHRGLLSLMSRTKTSTGTEAWNLPSDAVTLSKYLATCSRSRVFLEEILHSSPTWLMANWPRGSPSKKMGVGVRS